DCFLGAINFIEALVGIADKLFEVPKGDRTAELRNLLRVLEVEMLPSNVTYIPIGNQRHRVWRVVADESIAISTKERVPCIVYLEVALYGEEDPETVKLNKWWRQKRHPQRHNNFLEKGFQVLTNRMSSISKAWDKIENSFINDGEDEATERDEEEGGGGKSAYVPSRGSSSGGRGLRSVVESPGGDSSNSEGGGIGSNSRGNSDNYASGGLTIDGSMTPPESQIYTAANMGQWSSPVRSSEGGGRP
ncbi:hypothetical protein TrCOL_g13718, partial [Triparma columacea]